MKRPTEPGYYWWKPYRAAEFEPVRIRRNKAGQLVIHWLNKSGFGFIENESGIWGGAAIPPDDPEQIFKV